jgi:acetolactate synthase-1/2/3 large subunit
MQEPSTERTAETSSTKSPETGGQLLVRCLEAQGVDVIFGVPGESYLPILDALHDTPRTRFVCCRHEGAAANMAEADGKLTGRPGVCLVTRGPGAMHAAIGIHTASQDSTPMLLLIGQVPRGNRGRDAWQEIDYEKVFGPVAKWVAEIDAPERIPELIARAYSIALSGRPGPVVLSLPEDVLSSNCAGSPAPVSIRSAPQPAPAAADLEALEKRLRAAQRPLMIVGGTGWGTAESAALAAFAGDWLLPVVASFRRQDLFDNTHPSFIGHAGVGVDPKLAARIRSADLILAAGCRLNDPATSGYSLLSVPRPRQALVHIHPDPQELGRVYQPDLAICSTMSNAMPALQGLHAPTPTVWKAWREEARRDFLDFTRKPPKGERSGVDLFSVVLHLAETLPPDAIVTNGAGNYTVWVHRYFHFQRLKTQLAPVSGAMGYGLPAAIAAKRRFPSRQVVCFAGDGCFLMYPQEISTAVQLGAAVIVLVVNNRMYGTIRMHQERQYPGRPIGTDLPETDFVALARAFGAYGERVDTTEAFPAALQRAFAAGGPAVLELRVDPLQITPEKRIAASTA